MTEISESVSMAKSPGNALRLQDDFYQAVNAEWLEANPIPGHMGIWGNFHQLHEMTLGRLKELLEAVGNGELRAEDCDLWKEVLLVEDLRWLGTFYQSGLNGAVRDAESLGYINHRWVESILQVDDEFDLMVMLGEMHAAGMGGLFRCSVGIDDKQPDKHMIVLSQGGLNFSSNPEYYLKMDKKSIELRRKYKEFVTAGLGLSLAGLEWDAKEPLPLPVSEVLLVEMELALASKKPEEMRDPEKNYNPMTFRELKKRYDSVAWDHYFHAYGFRDLGLDDVLIVEQPEFFDVINTMLSDWTGVRDLCFYLWWCCVAGLAPYAGTELSNLALEFYGKTMRGAKELKPRWQYVLETINGNWIGGILGKLYAGKYFSRAAREKLESMIDAIVAVYGERLQGLPWMSGETKEFALRKLAVMGRQIGFPDVWESDYYQREEWQKMLNHWKERGYGDFLQLGDLYVRNCVLVNAWHVARSVALLRTPVDKRFWYMMPQIINACYEPIHNQMTYPAAILQAPFFSETMSDAENFGAICVIIGHEITHGFDDQGCKYDEKGVLRNWWTENDRRNFQALVQDMIAVFNGVYIFPDAHVNGELTVGENIADLGGLTMSYHAYRAYAAERKESVDMDTFFRSYARMWRTNTSESTARNYLRVDPHSPAKWRVNTILGLFKEFREFYGVREGDGMHSSRELVIW